MELERRSADHREDVRKFLLANKYWNNLGVLYSKDCCSVECFYGRVRKSRYFNNIVCGRGFKREPAGIAG